MSKKRKMEGLVASEVRRGEGGMRVGEFDIENNLQKGKLLNNYQKVMFLRKPINGRLFFSENLND